eukprot:TRINITY_DN2852_c0_g1_i10.p1 TRINITY_DN2852_c0_g1~~TRINITY_DN2852_c0_g1_i10.p1  ORF type:complete len:557 (-),score=123.35 TRINITY_DN2852_c0_g1_i10:193-1863(-)
MQPKRRNKSPVKSSEAITFVSKYEVVKSFKQSATCLVKGRKDRKLYVAKRVSLVGVGEEEKEKALREVRIMRALRHPNIVSLKETFEEKRELVLVTEYCEESDLGQLLQIRRERRQHFEEKLLLNWLLQLLFGLEFIHSRRVLHRDISLTNIFLTAKGTIKIGNFGVAKALDHTNQAAISLVGAPHHFSPEQCQSKPYTTKTDLWALGCVLYELCAMKPPFEGKSLVELCEKIVSRQHEPIPKGFSPPLRGLIDRLLAKDPKNRPEIREVIGEKFMVETMRDFIKARGAITDTATLGLVKERLESNRSAENDQKLRLQKIYRAKPSPKMQPNQKGKGNSPISDEGRYGERSPEYAKDYIIDTSRTEPKESQSTIEADQPQRIEEVEPNEVKAGNLSQDVVESKEKEHLTVSLKKSALPSASQMTYNGSNVSCNLSLTMDSVLLAKHLGHSVTPDPQHIQKSFEENKGSMDIDKISEDLSEHLEERDDFEDDSFDEAEVVVRGDNGLTSMEEVLDIYKSQLLLTSQLANMKEYVNGLEVITEATIENSSQGTLKSTI